jgi:hypothetical protein
MFSADICSRRLRTEPEQMVRNAAHHRCRHSHRRIAVQGGLDNAAADEDYGGHIGGDPVIRKIHRSSGFNRWCGLEVRCPMPAVVLGRPCVFAAWDCSVPSPVWPDPAVCPPPCPSGGCALIERAQCVGYCIPYDAVTHSLGGPLGD